MKSRIALPISILMLATTSSPLLSQTVAFINYDPAVVPIDKTLSQLAKARITTAGYAACVVKADRRLAEDFVTLFPHSRAARSAVIHMLNFGCLYEGSLFLRQELLRGALYRQLYIRSFSNFESTLRSEPIDLASDVAGQPESAARPYILERQFAECVVRSDPRMIRQIVLAPVASGAESSAFSAARPSFNPCFPTGATVEFSKSVLSSLLAEVLYRLSVKPVAQATSGYR